MRPYDRPGLSPVPTPVCHWTGGCPASSGTGVTHVKVYFSVESTKDEILPAKAEIFELIFDYINWSSRS